MQGRPIDDDEVVRRFTSHPMTELEQRNAAELRAAAAGLATLIVGLTPASREQSLAITSLEESVFWANAAIARRS